jgi:hypothetical protein
MALKLFSHGAWNCTCVVKKPDGGSWNPLQIFINPKLQQTAYLTYCIRKNKLYNQNAEKTNFGQSVH